MRRQLFLSALAAVGLCLVAADARPDEAPSIFIDIQTDPKPFPSDGRYLQTTTVILDKEALRTPSQRLTLNLPGSEPEVVELVRWQPRQGYIQIPDPDDPTGLGSITIPDPSARPEDFWWRWYGRSANYTVALTAVKGVIAGRITSATRRYAVDPRGDGSRNLLGLVNSAFWQTHPNENRPKIRMTSPPRSASIAPTPTKSVSDPVAIAKRSGWDSNCSGPLPGGQQVIDVLLLYTSEILAWYGSPTLVQSALESALDDANDSLRNSGIYNVTFSPRGPEFLPDPPSPPS